MSFNIQNIPAVIQGTVPQPILYGKSAHAQCMDYLNAAQDYFRRTGDLSPVDQLNQTSIRYTPEGTIAKGAVTEEALQNALGYSAADIAQLDQHGDQALNRQELFQSILTPAQNQLDTLEQTLQDPSASEAEKTAALEYKNLILNYTLLSAANYLASVDTPNSDTGQRDGLITADEAAAKLLFDDSAKQMFEDNQEAYQTIIGGLQTKTDCAGPSFEQLNCKN